MIIIISGVDLRPRRVANNLNLEDSGRGLRRPGHGHLGPVAAAFAPEPNCRCVWDWLKDAASRGRPSDAVELRTRLALSSCKD